MNKKKFPKAVLRTADQMREAGRAVTTKSTTPDNVIEMVPKTESPGAVAAPQGALAEAAALRQRQARAVVERYANLSAVGGAIPMPLVNAAAIVALLIRMVKSLSTLYGVPFERNRTRAIIIALMGGALPTGFSTIATSSIGYFVPGLNLLGLAMSSVTSAAYARSIGELYIEHFEIGATPEPNCAAAQFSFLVAAAACSSIFLIRLLGRISVQFLLM
jgi:uncharacterized protein (DUF697 family)